MTTADNPRRRDPPPHSGGGRERRDQQSKWTGETPMGTAASGPKGFIERTRVSCERPMTAASVRQQYSQTSFRTLTWKGGGLGHAPLLLRLGQSGAEPGGEGPPPPPPISPGRRSCARALTEARDAWCPAIRDGAGHIAGPLRPCAPLLPPATASMKCRHSIGDGTCRAGTPRPKDPLDPMSVGNGAARGPWPARSWQRPLGPRHRQATRNGGSNVSYLVVQQLFLHQKKKTNARTNRSEFCRSWGAIANVEFRLARAKIRIRQHNPLETGIRREPALPSGTRVWGGAWTTRPPPRSTAPSAPIPQEPEDEMASTIELGALLDMRMARYLRNVDPLQGTLGAKASLRKEPAPDPTHRPPSGRRRTQWFEEKPKVWEWKTLE